MVLERSQHFFFKWKKRDDILAFFRFFTRTHKQSRDKNQRFPPLSESSDDSIVPERLEQHRVLDIAEDPADVVGVCGAGEVWVESLSLLPLVVVDGLLLVQLADVVFGVLGVSFLPCQRGEKETRLMSGTRADKMSQVIDYCTDRK